MKITTELESNNLYLVTKSEDRETIIKTVISSFISERVKPETVTEFHKVLLEIGKYNGQSDVKTCKQFIEDSLTENEIRELVRLLEN